MAEVKKGKRGKKICPGCNTELGVRTGTCPNCGFDFSSLKKEKEVKSGTGTGTEIKIKTEVETGETEENEEIQEEQQPVKETAYSREMRELLIHMMAHPVNNIDKLTPREHAERILAQGKESALILLKLHNYGTKWRHVDWKYVAENLGEESIPEEIKEEE